MSGKEIFCPQCGTAVIRYSNPAPTVDIIIEVQGAEGGEDIVLIRRKNEPYGWALPGGFVDYGETLEQAADREAREETGLRVKDLRQLHSYSDPKRDPRGHTVSTVFIARGEGILQAGDDASGARVFSKDELPQPLAFDHAAILQDYYDYKKEKKKRKRIV